MTFDPTTAVPKLIFRADALLEVPPSGYDVDVAVYRYLRTMRDERLAQQEAYAYVGAKSVLAEGGSWFNLPEFVRPPAIADWIPLHRRFRVKNIARWGHTLREILRDREYVAILERDRPDYFMFTAGGNDLQNGLETGLYIHAYDPNLPLDGYLTSDGFAELTRIESGFLRLFSEVSTKYPQLPILCHGYDYCERPYKENPAIIQAREFWKINIKHDNANNMYPYRNLLLSYFDLICCELCHFFSFHVIFTCLLFIIMSVQYNIILHIA